MNPALNRRESAIRYDLELMCFAQVAYCQFCMHLFRGRQTFFNDISIQEAESCELFLGIQIDAFLLTPGHIHCPWQVLFKLLILMYLRSGGACREAWHTRARISERTVHLADRKGIYAIEKHLDERMKCCVEVSVSG